MFYHNTKYRFAMASPADRTIAGALIAASSMIAGQLHRRDFTESPYLQHRLLDPQLYLAGLDPNIAPDTVVKLASFPWFCESTVPEYDSAACSQKQWKDRHRDQLLAEWPRRVARDPAAIRRATQTAIEHQLRLGVEGIILPGPLTTIADQSYEAEIAWVDEGVRCCAEMGVSVPIYATVALSEQIFRNVDPFSHPTLHLVTSEIASRSELAGAYVVVEQSATDSYVWTAREVLVGLLLMVDDLARGAKKRVICNYLGSFGAVAEAVGASIWSTGYYLSQRRLNLASIDDTQIRFAKPRYYSVRLAGDVGVEQDIKKLYDAGITQLISTSPASQPLEAALRSGRGSGAVPSWQSRPSNVTAAIDHYTHVHALFGASLAGYSRSQAIEMVHRWLARAAVLADQCARAGASTTHTDLVHQRIWLDAFETWRRYAEQ